MKGYCPFIYSTIMLIFVTVSLGRHIATEFTPSIIRTLNALVWDIQSMGHFILFYLSSVRSYHSKFYDAWQEYHQKYNIGPGTISKQAVLSTVIMWFVVLICIIPNAFMVYESYQLVLDIEGDTGIFEVYPTISLVSYAIAGAYTLFTWTASSVYFILICKLLGDEFRSLNEDMKSLHSSHQDTFYKSVGNFRSRHCDLCRVVRKADNVFCGHLGLTIFASASLSCLSLYILIWDQSRFPGVFTIAICSIWLGLNLSKMTIDCLAAIHLNMKVSNNTEDQT